MGSYVMMHYSIAFGVIMVVIGITLFVLSDQIVEYSYDYTDCVDVSAPGRSCNSVIYNTTRAGTSSAPCVCQKQFMLDKIDKPVLVYYKLTNYHQNHRRYVRSYDVEQIMGEDLTPGELDDVCEPFKAVTIKNKVYGYAPCGAIANSIFNDTFKIWHIPYTGTEKQPIALTSRGIAYTTDQDEIFNNPSSWKDFTKPKYWSDKRWEFDVNDPDNSGYNNEELIVWMRTASLSTFRKLYRRVDHRNHTTDRFRDGLPKGTYQIDITYNFPVAKFGATKSVIITHASVIGMKNPLIGTVYFGVGALSVLGAVFLGLLFHYHHSNSKDSLSIVKEHRRRRVRHVDNPYKRGTKLSISRKSSAGGMSSLSEIRTDAVNFLGSCVDGNKSACRSPSSQAASSRDEGSTVDPAGTPTVTFADRSKASTPSPASPGSHHSNY